MPRKRDRGPNTSALTSKNDVDSVVVSLLDAAGINSTQTKAGWCLRQGLAHVMAVDGGRMIPIIQQQGPPPIYTFQECCHGNGCAYNDSNGNDKPRTCFQSLCRIIAGQQLAGAAARTVWNRLLKATGNNLTPGTVIELAEQGMEEFFQKPSGLSRAKATSIISLAEAFHKQDLTESFLKTSSESEIRESLLKIKGIGPWSCDMFLMFFLEMPNVLPVGDLGVRKGIANYFSLRGKGKGGSLCPKHDREAMEKALEPYKPYQSLVTYYMWRVADTKDFYSNEVEMPSASPTKRQKTKIVRQVTP